MTDGSAARNGSALVSNSVSSIAANQSTFAAPDFSTLVEIQTEGDRIPIFCTPAADGFTRVYHELSDHLGNQQPVYGLDSPGIYGLPIADTMEAMAAGLVQEIRAVQPHGPYIVIGYCSGGTVAYEIAQQLISAGEKVALTVLIETYNWLDAPSTNPSTLTNLGYELQRVDFHVRNFFLLNLSDKKQFLAAKWKALRNRTGVWKGLIASKLRLNKKQAKRTMTATNVNMADLWRKHDDLAEAYVPKPYLGRLVHFRPQRDYKCHLGTELEATEGVEYHRLRAYPAGVMVNPFVEEVARLLEKKIDECCSVSK